MAREFKYKGKTPEELSQMGLSDLVEILPARIRRTIGRGLTEDQKKLLKKIETNKKRIKTQVRDMPILPQMFGKTIEVHNGKEWIKIAVNAEMIGHYLGEFTQTRKQVKHSGPGVGATRGSRSQSVK